MTTNDVSDIRISTEQLRKMLAAIPRYVDGKVRSSDWVGRVPAPTLEAILTELLASRTQSPAEWHKRLHMTRKALERAEKFAADYEFDSDEGFHVPSDLERMLMLDMLNGLFDDEEFIAALDATPPAPERSKEEVGFLRLINFTIQLMVDSVTWDQATIQRVKENIGGLVDQRLSALELASGEVAHKTWGQWEREQQEPTPVAPVPVTITPEMLRAGVAAAMTHSGMKLKFQVEAILSAALSAKPTGEE